MSAAAPALDGATSLLDAAFAALDAGGVSWCLLRAERGRRRRPHDVDLLVDRGDVGRLRALLSPLGFAPVPVRGRHRFFAAYDAPERHWLVLDVVDELSPRHGERRLVDASAVLGRVVREEGAPVPDPDDRFWLALAHELLDRGELAPERFEALQELAAGACAGSATARAVAGRLGAEPERLLELVHGGSREALRAPAVPRRRPAPARRLARATARLRVRAARRGVSVAILGPDGSGKSTLAAGLVGSFPLPARCIYMGLQRGSSVPGKTWRPVADGPRRRRPLPRRVARQLRRLARYGAHAAVARAHLAAGSLVVFDRYTYDAAVHWENARGPGGRLRLWLVRHVAPRPDVVLVLDVPGETMYARKQEHDPTLLERRRRLYLELAETLPQSVVLDGTREPAAVLAAATDAVWRRYVGPA